MKNEYAKALGSIKTERKAVASRENGKLGGRPRKPMEIPLTQGKVALVDREDYEKLMKYKWRCLVRGKSMHATAWESSTRKGRVEKNSMLHMHRIIMGLNPHDKVFVDHIDGNGLNNRRSNLRLCTPSQNQMNRGANANNTSGFKGVSFNARDKKWQARIKVNRRPIQIGSFATALDAYKAYCEACVKYHGEFARTK